MSMLTVEIWELLQTEYADKSSTLPAQVSLSMTLQLYEHCGPCCVTQQALFL